MSHPQYEYTLEQTDSPVCVYALASAGPTFPLSGLGAYVHETRARGGRLALVCVDQVLRRFPVTPEEVHRTMIEVFGARAINAPVHAQLVSLGLVARRLPAGYWARTMHAPSFVPQSDESTAFPVELLRAHFSSVDVTPALGERSARRSRAEAVAEAENPTKRRRTQSESSAIMSVLSRALDEQLQGAGPATAEHDVVGCSPDAVVPQVVSTPPLSAGSGGLADGVFSLDVLVDKPAEAKKDGTAFDYYDTFFPLELAVETPLVL
eukprot:m51a1_g87 hypothetical protein (265) ;mRNA; r:280021-281090